MCMCVQVNPLQRNSRRELCCEIRENILQAASFSVNEDRGIFVTYRKSGLCNVLIILPLSIILDTEMEYKLAL